MPTFKAPTATARFASRTPRAWLDGAFELIVSVQLLSKQETDTREDFETGADFAAIFETNYIHEE